MTHPALDFLWPLRGIGRRLAAATKVAGDRLLEALDGPVTDPDILSVFPPALLLDSVGTALACVTRRKYTQRQRSAVGAVYGLRPQVIIPMSMMAGVNG